MPVTTDAEAATPPGGRQRNENGELEERQTEPLRTPRPGEQSPNNTAGAGLLQVLTMVLVTMGWVTHTGTHHNRLGEDPSGSMTPEGTSKNPSHTLLSRDAFSATSDWAVFLLPTKPTCADPRA